MSVTALQVSLLCVRMEAGNIAIKSASAAAVDLPSGMAEACIMILL